MRLATVFSLTALVARTYGTRSTDPFEQWQAPGDSDVRGPCPFLNTFANHGFLPRSGKYITEQDLIDGLSKAVNFDAALSKFLFNFAVTTNPEPNSTWFSLDHLTRHNILEHDASLSRVDSYFGHADVFDHRTFEQTRSYWGDKVTLGTGTDAIIARIRTSNATNPEFSLSELGFDFILGETFAFIAVLGDTETLTVKASVVEYLFKNQRLPTQLGWKRSDEPFTTDGLGDGIRKMYLEYEKRVNSTSPRKRSPISEGRVSNGRVRLGAF